MTTTAIEIQALYIAYFNRPADFLGLSYQMAQADAFGINAVAANFSHSPEYTTLYAGKSAAEIVDTIYVNLFGRHAEPDGITFWGNLLLNGTLPVSEIALQILHGAQNDDLTAINNKIAAAGLFYAALDTSDEIVGYSGDAANAIAKAWLGQVTTDASLTTQTAVIATAITAAVDAHNSGTGTTFTLTDGVDAFVGTSGNDTVIATDTTFTGLDTIDGGAGVNKLTISDVAGGIDLSLATVHNIQTAVITSTAGYNNETADLSGWTGLTSATLTMKAGAAANVTVGDDVAVTITNTTAQAVTLTGGVTANITNNVGGSINVTGETLTSLITKGGDAINVVDSGTSATLTTVTMTNFNDTAALTGDGITTVNITTNNAQDVTISNGEDHELALNLNAFTAALISDNTATAVTLHNTGKASAVTAVFSSATAMSISGDAAVTLSNSDLSSLATLTLTTSAAFTSDLSGAAALTAIDASGTSGTNTVTVDATTASYVGGSAVDVITIEADATMSIDGGTGVADEIVMNFNAATLDKSGDNVTGFEILGLSSTSQGTYDLSTFTGFTAVDVQGATATAVVFTNAAAGQTISIVGALTHDIEFDLKVGTGKTDTLSFTLGTSKTTGVDAASAGSLVITNDDIEILHMASLGKSGSNDIVLSDAGATTLVLTGTSDTDFTGSTFGALKSVDLTGVTAKHTITIDDSSFYVTSGTTVTAADAIVMFEGNAAATKVDTITLGNGKGSSITETHGNNVVKVGNGADLVIDLGDGNNKVTVGNGGGSTITVGNGGNTIVDGTGADEIHVGSGLNTVTLGGGADTLVIDTAFSDNGNIYTTVTDFTTKGAMIDLTAVDAAMVEGADITDALNAGTSVFQDYLNYAVKSTDAHDVSWFTFGGNTYVVDNVSDDASGFVNGQDFVLKLNGIVDLTDMVGAAVITHG